MSALTQVCEPIEPSYLTWSQPYGWGMLILATTGLVATGAIFTMMVYHRDRRVIKGSSQEVSAQPGINIM